MPDEQAIRFLQEDRPQEFNAHVERTGGVVDLTGIHLRGYDLRKFNLGKANLSGAYMRGADLRGLDLTHANLDGASMAEAKVSGVLFPRNLDATEISLSIQYGTRMRARL